jgi:DtxR family Mn-dependent transcriptional regulator
MKLTAAQQDYLEVICRLELDIGVGAVRVSDIAEQLGTRLPTVSRTVRRLAEAGLVSHKARGEVSLTAIGRKTAQEVVHRHDDLVDFFENILGLDRDEAEMNAASLEHGLSNVAAQRLHEFLEYVHQLPAEKLEPLARFARRAAGPASEFKHIDADKPRGWRA